MVGRRAGAEGQPVDVVDGDWPPDGGEETACPVCARDTSAPWA